MRKGKFISCNDQAGSGLADCHSALTVTVVSPSVLQLAGVLDLNTRDLLHGLLSEHREPELHVDVAGLEFADAAGLDVLARADAHRRAGERGRLVLHRPRPLLQRTLIAAGLQRLLPWCPDGDKERNWRLLAACHDAPVPLFFEDEDPLPARRLCWSCPVSGDCLSYALRTSQCFGVWGGLTARERAVLQGSSNAVIARRTP